MLQQTTTGELGQSHYQVELYPIDFAIPLLAVNYPVLLSLLLYFTFWFFC